MIVTEKKITIRRIDYIDQETIKLLSDDPNYPMVEIKPADVFEFWLVLGKYSTYLHPPKLVEEKLLRLEKRLELLEKKVME